MLGKGFTFRKVASFNFKFIAICFYFLFWKAVFWLFRKILRKNSKKKNYSGDEVEKKMKFSDFFLRIFLKNRIFLPRYSPKESCKKWFNCALWAMYLSVRNYEIEWEPFSALFYETVIFKQKRKNHFHEIFSVVWLILIHIERLLYLQEKKYIIIWNFFLF